MNRKKIGQCIWLVSLFAVVIAASVAVTYALGTELVGFGDPVHNKFKNGTITAVLHENTWDGSTSTTTESQVAALVAADAEEDTPTLGINIANPYRPGVAIPKNPMVTNTSTTSTEWIGVQAYVKVTFHDADQYAATTQVGTTGNKVVYYSLKEFNDRIATLDNNKLVASRSTASSWYYSDASANPDVLLYTSVVAAEAATEPIFTSVTVIPPSASVSGVTLPAQIDAARAGASSPSYGDGTHLNYFRYNIPRSPDAGNDLSQKFTGVNSNLNFVYTKQYPTFEIYLKGCAIQGDFTTYSDTALNNLITLLKPTT